MNEFCRDDAEERAIVIGVAQTFGQAFIAWVPLLILNVGKYAPRFHLGFSVMSGISVVQFAMIFVIRYFVKQDKEKKSRVVEQGSDSGAQAKHQGDITPYEKAGTEDHIKEISQRDEK